MLYLLSVRLLTPGLKKGYYKRLESRFETPLNADLERVFGDGTKPVFLPAGFVRGPRFDSKRAEHNPDEEASLAVESKPGYQRKRGISDQRCFDVTVHVAL